MSNAATDPATGSGPEAAGATTAGPEPAGQEASGPEPAGPEAPGLQAPGPPVDGDEHLGTGSPSRRFGMGTLVVAVVAALLAGFAVAVLTLRPDPTPGDTSPEAGFARDMITHHDQAVEMGMIAYTDATLPGVRQLGYDIATNQQGQIGMMQQWLRNWDLLPTGSQPPMAWMEGGNAFTGSPMPGMATREQMQQLRDAEGTEVDRLFLELMTAHHLGGIHMAEGVLAMSDDEDVVWLAELMVAGQQQEIEVLQQLQDQLDTAGTD